MMLTFAEFLPALFEALGGEEIPRASDAPLSGGARRWESRARHGRLAAVQ